MITKADSLSMWTNHKTQTEKNSIPGSSGRSQRLFLHYFTPVGTNIPFPY